MIHSAKEFVRLRKSADPEEYRRAAHDSASEEVWLEVIACFPAMREWVAHNKTSPIAVLRILAKDLDPRVRSVVAGVRRIDHDMFAMLAADEDPSVRGAVACNAKTPRDVRERLANDPEEHIAAWAKKRLIERP